jgi:hypothetical protein
MEHSQPVSLQMSGAGDPMRMQQVHDRRRHDGIFVCSNACAESGTQVIQGGMDGHALWKLSYCTCCTCKSVPYSFHMFHALFSVIGFWLAFSSTTSQPYPSLSYGDVATLGMHSRLVEGANP